VAALDLEGFELLQIVAVTSKATGESTLKATARSTIIEPLEVTGPSSPAALVASNSPVLDGWQPQNVRVEAEWPSPTPERGLFTIRTAGYEVPPNAHRRRCAALRCAALALAVSTLTACATTPAAKPTPKPKPFSATGTISVPTEISASTPSPSPKFQQG